jgi:fructose-bisphosphate aldolase, class I
LAVAVLGDFDMSHDLDSVALETWTGKDENLEPGRQALYHRARCSGAARLGNYADEMEADGVGFSSSPHRHQWRDD